MRRARRAWRRGDRYGALEQALRAWKHSRGLRTGREARVRGWLAQSLRTEDGQLRAVAENPFWKVWRESEEARTTRRDFAGYPDEDRLRLRTPRPDAPPWRVGDLVVLKRHVPETGELGALLVTYNHGISWFSAMLDLAKLAGKYVVVLEPSTWGYQDVRFLPYIGSDLDVLVHAQSLIDYHFIASLDCNLVPSHLGAGDWVDPTRFHPKPHADRQYDAVMVGSWDPLKRHGVLFRALRTLRDEGRTLKVALVGYPLGWQQVDVERLAERIGVRDQLTLFDFIPYDDVGKIQADSRVSVLLSKREGANRAIYEAWMADTPTIVYRHHRGVNLSQITPANGVLADDDELVEALKQVLDAPGQFSPRAWAEANTGCFAATAQLNTELRAISEKRGRPWTTDCVVRAYAGYMSPDDQEAMGAEHEQLRECFLAP